MKLDIRKSNRSMLKILNHLASTFQNSAEMGAQEAVYHLLSMSLCKPSRQTVFNMYRSKDRHMILKKAKWLEIMNPNDTDVFRTGLFLFL